MESIHITPPYLWRLNYDFNYENQTLQEHVGKLIEHTQNNWATGSVLETGSAISTVYNQQQAPHKWEILEDFLLWLQPKLIDIGREWGYPNGMPYPVRSWVNVHKRSGTTREHYHNGSPFVVSCYLKMPSGSGLFEYRDPLEYHRWGMPGEPQNTLWTPVEIETNDILVFPGWLKHRTQPSITNEDRVCLTFNYDTNF